MHLLTRYLILCSACFCIWGCGEEEPVREKTVPVSGTVKYKGNPVAGADVTLVPETPLGQAATKKGAFARTDESGAFTLMTFQAGDGAVPGKYKVTVKKYEQAASAEVSDEDPNYVPPEEMPNKPSAPKSLVPEKYGDPNKTPLNVEIKDGENPPLELDLTDN